MAFEDLGDILLKIDGSIAGLVEALGEATAAIDAFAEVADHKLHDAGKEGGRKFGDGVEEEVAKRDFAAMLGKALKKMTDVGSGAAGGVPGFLRKLAMPAMWTTLIYGASQAVAALLPAVGALGLIPAAASAAAFGLTTLKEAFHGVGAALKAGLSGNTAKFAEALKKLAPAAQDAVKALISLQPQIKALRDSVQQSFFSGLARDIRDLGNRYLPLLRSEMSHTAHGFNTALREVTGWLKLPDTFNSIRHTLGNMSSALAIAAHALLPFLSGLNDLVEVGSKFLPGLAAGFVAVADKFSGFMAEVSSNGSLAAFIQAGLDTLKLLGPLLKDVWGVLHPIIQALQATGGGGLGILGTLLHQLALFLNSAQGMATLTSIFQILNTLFGVLGDTLAALLPSLATLIVSLAPVLIALIKALEPALLAAASGFATVVGWLAPLIPYLAKAAPLITILAEAVLGLLVPATIAWTITMLQAAAANIAATWEILVIIAALAALGYGIFELIKHWRTVWDWIKRIAGDVAHFFVGIWHHVQRVFDDVWGAIKDAAKAVAGFFVKVWQDVTGALSSALAWIEALPGRVGDAIDKIPGLVRDGLMGLAYLVGFALGKIVKEAADLPFQIWHILTSLWSGALTISSKGLDALNNFLIHTLPHAIAGAWDTARHWVAATADGLWKDAVHYTIVGVKAVLDWAQKLPGRLGHFFAESWNSIWAELKTWPSKIWNGVKDAGKWLFNTGKDLVGGLIRGIESQWDAAIGVVKDLGHNMWKGFKDAMGMHSPSKVFAEGGAFLVAGLVHGINANAGAARAAVAGLIGFGGGGIGAPAFTVGHMLGSGGAATIELHVHSHNYLDGKELHAGLIQPAQRYRIRTGTTGLETPRIPGSTR